MSAAEFTREVVDNVFDTEGEEKWNATLSRFDGENQDSLPLLEELLGFYEEVSKAATMYADAVTTLIWGAYIAVCSAFPSLSDISPAEHGRITCAFWILRIYYQVMDKCVVTWDVMEIMEKYFWPCDLERALMVEQLLDAINYPSSRAIYYLHGAEPFLSRIRWTLKCPYVETYFAAIERHYPIRRLLGRRPLPSFVFRLRKRHGFVLGEQAWFVFPNNCHNEPSRPLYESNADEWRYYLDLPTSAVIYFTTFGMMFWNQDRLEALGLAEGHTFQHLCVHLDRTA
jgi:hypothetical protein